MCAPWHVVQPPRVFCLITVLNKHVLGNRFLDLQKNERESAKRFRDFFQNLLGTLIRT